MRKKKEKSLYSKIKTFHKKLTKSKPMLKKSNIVVEMPKKEIGSSWDESSVFFKNEMKKGGFLFE